MTRTGDRPEVDVVAASNGIGYRPDERLSWAVFLIPYLSEEYRGWIAGLMRAAWLSSSRTRCT